MKMLGWGRRYWCRAVVPHLGAPTMKKFGLAANGAFSSVAVRGSGTPARTAVSQNDIRQHHATGRCCVNATGRPVLAGTVSEADHSIQLWQFALCYSRRQAWDMLGAPLVHAPQSRR